jgi:RNA polymerase sigma-54 factor
MLHQSQLQKQSFKILPQQIQMLGIYHLNTIQLEQRIKDELDENPLLENNSEEEHLEATEKDQPQEYQDWEEYGYDDIPDYKVENESFIHSNNVNLPMRDFVDFRTLMKQQLINLDLTGDETTVAEYIIDCLEDNGFLERNLGEIADDISFSQKLFVEENMVEAILLKIQELEPFGMGSRNIQEFLLKQLNHQKQCPIVKKSIQLIEKLLPRAAKTQFR